MEFRVGIAIRDRLALVMAVSAAFWIPQPQMHFKWRFTKVDSAVVSLTFLSLRDTVDDGFKGILGVMAEKKRIGPNIFN